MSTASTGMSGHRPQRGSTVAFVLGAAHDGGMHPTPRSDGVIAVGAARGSVRIDLEEFWPSRRSHAYDEFCR